MIINLTFLKVAYINLEEYPNRNATMVNMLNHYGLDFIRVEGVRRIRHDEFDPIASAHINALNTGADLILEDDCVPFNYRNTIEIPDDSDVVFLGISTGTTHTIKPKYKKLSDDIYRLYDMTTTHAVLYVTEAGRQWLRNAYDMTAKENIGFDISTAKLMPTINAYGLNSPVWYQFDLGSQTKLTLDEALFSDEYFGGGLSDYTAPIAIY
jgi:hypothetical protein